MITRLILPLLGILLNAAFPAGDAAAADTPFPVTVEDARESEKQNRLPLTAFYDTPKPFPAGAPGQLIRWEESSDYMFQPDTASTETGIRVVRFLYHSRAFDGKDVPASGVILIPYGDPPEGGWPVVAWAHGTTGVSRIAAPSLDKRFVYGWEGLLIWPVLGYAVVAPDYAGLGTDVPHQYLVVESQANDLVNALPAAHAAVPELGAKWVAIGHSQGARAVIEVAEMQATIADPGYLGAISLAPGGDLGAAGLAMINDFTYRAYLAFIAYGVKAAFPEFNYGELLTPEAAALMPEVDTGGWLATMATFAYGVPPGKMLNPDWTSSETIRRFFDLTLPGEDRTRGPILLLAGDSDTTSPPAGVEAHYKRLRGSGADITYQIYPGLDHDPLVFGTFRDQLRWVEDRLAGKPVVAE